MYPVFVSLFLFCFSYNFNRSLTHSGPSTGSFVPSTYISSVSDRPVVAWLTLAIVSATAYRHCCRVPTSR